MRDVTQFEVSVKCKEGDTSFPKTPLLFQAYPAAKKSDGKTKRKWLKVAAQRLSDVYYMGFVQTLQDKTV